MLPRPASRFDPLGGLAAWRADGVFVRQKKAHEGSPPTAMSLTPFLSNPWGPLFSPPVPGFTGFSLHFRDSGTFRATPAKAPPVQTEGQRRQNQGPGLQMSLSFPNVWQGTVRLTSASLLLPRGSLLCRGAATAGTTTWRTAGARQRQQEGAFANTPSTVPFRSGPVCLEA